MATIESDSFIRAAVPANGWGTATNGHTWTVNQPNGTYSTSGTQGQIASSSGNRIHLSLGVTTYGNQEVLARFTAASASDDFGVDLRISGTSGGSGVSGYRFSVNGNGGSGILGCTRLNSGTGTALGSTATKTVAANGIYWIRCKIVGNAASSVISGRMWTDGSSEPSTYDYTFTDTSAIATGAPGITAVAFNASPIKIDNFSANDTVPNSASITETATASELITISIVPNGAVVIETATGSESISAIRQILATITETATGSEVITMQRQGFMTITELASGSERAYVALRQLITETATGSESISGQVQAISDPSVQMQMSDLVFQYSRLRASQINRNIKILATTYYGNPSSSSTINGELDVVFKNETINQLHACRTVGDVTALLQAYSYQSVVLADNPAAYYRLGEASGYQPTDTSGHYGSGLISGGVTPGNAGAIAGNPDTSMLFNGTSGYIVLPTTLKTDNWSAFTVECWFKLSNNTFTTYPCLIANDYPTSDYDGFQLYLSPSTDGTSGYFVLGNSTTAYQLAFGSGVLGTSSWYHIAATYSNNTMTIYLNGTLVASRSASGVLGTAGYPISIAHYPSDSGYLPGALDEVAIYPYALSHDQALIHYNVGMGTV